MTIERFLDLLGSYHRGSAQEALQDIANKGYTYKNETHTLEAMGLIAKTGKDGGPGIGPLWRVTAAARTLDRMLREGTLEGWKLPFRLPW